MLIPLHQLLAKYPLTLRGALHLGAHECEERPAYLAAGLSDRDILWVDALAEKVALVRERLPEARIACAAVAEADGREVRFTVTNNYQSSSILALGTHRQEHPWVVETEVRQLRTVTVDTLLQCLGDYGVADFDPERINFLTMDLQGAELLALRGMSALLPQLDAVFTEVNDQHLYVDCALVHELDAFLRPYGLQRVEALWTQNHWGDAFYFKAPR